MYTLDAEASPYPYFLGDAACCSGGNGLLASSPRIWLKEEIHLQINRGANRDLVFDFCQLFRFSTLHTFAD